MQKQRYTVGVDIGGTKIVAGVVTPDGKVLGRSFKQTPKDTLVEESVISDISVAVDEAVRNSGINPQDLLAIGIGAAGLLDPEKGIIFEAPNIPQFKNTDLRTPLSQRFSIPCYIDNDVNVGTYGEYVIGAAKGMQDTVGIFLGTGIGGGIILNGKIHHGFNKTAGELGHIIVKYDGVPHPLGSAPSGTLEAYAGRVALAKAVASLYGKTGKKSLIVKYLTGEWVEFNPDAFLKSLEKEEEALKQLLLNTARIVGFGIVTLIHVLNPQMFVIGGGLMMALSDFLLPEIQRTVDNHSLPSARRGIKIVKAELGDDAGLIGAALLARDKALNEVNT